jgi:hypothetical protein
MVLLMLMSTNSRIMGQFCISAVWVWAGWISTAVMAVATVIFLIASASG